MKNKIVLVLMACLLLSMNFVFAASDANKTIPVYMENTKNISVTEKQPMFSFRLKSNPTTGYSWFLREYNANFITPVKHDFQAPERKLPEIKLMGASGYETWTFLVKPAAFQVPQQIKIRLIYMRPWESDDSAKQVVLSIATEGRKG